MPINIQILQERTKAICKTKLRCVYQFNINKSNSILHLSTKIIQFLTDFSFKLQMQQLEYTPSVYFNCGTINKNNLSAEIDFELSCTNQKYDQRSFGPIVSSIIDLQQPQRTPLPSSLKTEEFFEEFQNHFVVTFDEEVNQHEGQEKLGETASFVRSISCHSHKKSQEIEARCDDGFEKVDICLLRQDSKPSHITCNQPKKVSLDLSLVKNRKDIDYKERDSGIELEVKKRTVFKKKENLMSNAQQFKITKKKIINQDTLEHLSIQSKSCKTSKPRIKQSKPWFTSLPAAKDTLKPKSRALKNLCIETDYHSNIFHEHKQARESFRSTTLDNWKRKFQLHKKTMEQKTSKRRNIFQNPFVFR